MGPGPSPDGGIFGGQRDNDKFKEPKPKSLKEVPSYLWRVFINFFKRLFYIFTLVWEAKPSSVFILSFVCLFDGVMPAVGSYITKLLIDKLVLAINGTLPDFYPILSLLVLQFSYMFLKKLVSILSRATVRLSGEYVVNHIKLKISDKVKEIDLGSFDDPLFYERLENANREADSRPISILNATFELVSTVISIVTYFAILMTISSIAPLIIIGLAIPSAILNFYYRKQNFLYLRRNSKARRRMNYYNNLLVNKNMVKETKLLGTADTFISRYISTFKEYFAGIRGLIFREYSWMAGFSLFTLTGQCLIFLYIAYMVYSGNGSITVGDYTLYSGALTSIAGSVATLVSLVSTIYEGTLFIDNIICFLNEETKIVPRLKFPSKPTRHIAHSIEFKNVCFAYPGTDKNVLDDINFKIEAGETAVLVGLNGAGKTTLIKLLTRLYDPTEGEILLDGVNVKDFSVEEYYDIFGILFQDYGHYAVSVADNIMFGDIKRGDDRENIIKAAKESGADEFIKELPAGYDTPLTRMFEDNGIELSIGQWQKLSVARAFFKDSDIIILDEPTASLDPLAEQEVFDQFDRLKKGKTTLFVSHRLSSATTASKIIVLENGKVVEIGSHEKLMELHGKYEHLFTVQARRYIDGTETIKGRRNGEMPRRRNDEQDNS